MITAATVAAWASLSFMPMPPVVNVATTGWACPPEADACIVAPSTIYPPPARYSEYRQREIFMHEVGHLFDHQVLTSRARRYFQQEIHDERPWQEGPNEKFAEGYRICTSYRPGRGGGAYGYSVTKTANRRVCNLIRAAAHGAYG